MSKMSGPDVGLNDPGYQQSAKKNYRLTFKQNRSFELTVNGTVYFFDPHGKQENISEATINAMTPEQKSFFNVEVMQ